MIIVLYPAEKDLRVTRTGSYRAFGNESAITEAEAKSLCVDNQWLTKSRGKGKGLSVSRTDSTECQE